MEITILVVGEVMWGGLEGMKVVLKREENGWVWFAMRLVGYHCVYKRGFLRPSSFFIIVLWCGIYNGVNGVCEWFLRKKER